MDYWQIFVAFYVSGVVTAMYALWRPSWLILKELQPDNIFMRRPILSNFVVFLMTSWRPTWAQKQAKGKPKGARGHAKASLGGPCRLHFWASSANGGTLENIGPAHTNAGSGPPRLDTATP